MRAFLVPVPVFVPMRPMALSPVPAEPQAAIMTQQFATTTTAKLTAQVVEEMQCVTEDESHTTAEENDLDSLSDQSIYWARATSLPATPSLPVTRTFIQFDTRPQPPHRRSRSVA
ncbi:unnamed protein product [Effrenium voratum]|nr:unnamed protein product [Effrenium voratum]